MQKILMQIVGYAIKKPAKYLIEHHARYKFMRMSIGERFLQIYKLNYWESKESRSGAGSTLEYTENLRNCLPSLIAVHDIKTIFDAPCGDFNWMRHVLPLVDVAYIGADIVSELIHENNIKYKSDNVRFVILNVVDDKYPNADIMVCRDLLFHFSYDDTNKLLRNFICSGIPLLLTTNHINNLSFSNKDIVSGGFRLIDLFSAPYNFPNEPLARFLDYVHPYPPREMCLFSREQVISAIRNWG